MFDPFDLFLFLLSFAEQSSVNFGVPKTGDSPPLWMVTSFWVCTLFWEGQFLVLNPASEEELADSHGPRHTAQAVLSGGRR